MPGNVAAASPVGVLQKMLYIYCRPKNAYTLLTQKYHDNTVERGQITDGVNTPRNHREWELSAKFTASALSTFRTFVNDHNLGQIPFYWYDPMGVGIGVQIGSNWDGTGVSTQGRRVVVFSNVDYSEVVDIGRGTVPFSLKEVA